MAEPPTKISGSGGGGWTPLSVEELQVVLPAYEVIEMLGAGGMGAVYKARQRSLKRLVAIKILPLGMADDEFKFVERFRNEAETLAQMNHPAIVNVYDFGETPAGLLYFVMEFVDGTDLHQLIESSGQLTGEHAMSIAAHVCDALAYAHRHGVVHRDIKPANILINREGHVKVADFGLAKMENPSQTSGLTRTNMTMGTPDYAAPEVFTAGMITDHRADLYAVGVMLYQMLTGHVPRGMFKLPSQKTPGTDPRFDAIIVRAMEANRDERYQSAAEVRQALDEIRTTPLARDSGMGAISARSLPPRTVAKPAPSSEPKTASPGKMKWLAAAAVVTVLAIAGVAIFGGKKEEKPTPAASTAVAPVDEAFLAQVAASTPEKQVELVTTKIEALNGVRPEIIPEITSGRVYGVVVKPGDEKRDIPDLSPLNALRAMNYLRVETPGLRDISWLRGMKVATISFQGGTFTDLSVLKELSLQHVTFFGGPPRDYTILAGQPLQSFIMHGTSLRDLSFLKGMKLNNVRIERTGVTDLSPLREFALVSLVCDFVPERDTAILRAIPTLKTINNQPVAEFWAKVDGKAPATAAAQGELRAAGEELSVWSGTEQVASLRDARAQVGGWLLIGSPGVEITGVETSGITPNPNAISPTAEAPPSLPNATWQDVTESVREKARAKPELVVEADGVRHSGDGKTVDVSLGSQAGDRAVWVRYVGDAQVSLWFKTGNASAFVLAQRHQTIFQRVEKNASESVAMRPPIPHPAGFDASQPHELLVAVQGTAIRAWLDGRFVGEVQDEEIKGSSTALVFTKFTAVQKVEMADLPQGAATATPPKSVALENWESVLTKPADFGEQASFAEFRDGAAFLRERTIYAPGEATEGAIRAKLRYTEAETTGSLTIRSTEAARYGEEAYACTAFISDKGASVAVLLRDKAAGIIEPQRTAFTILPPLKNGELFLFELRAEHGQIAVSINGREAGRLPDPWQTGKRRAGITPANTGRSEFRDIAVRETAAEKWIDWLGPKLAALTEFQGKGWKREPGGVSTTLEIDGRMVLPEGTKDAAIRVTYVVRESRGMMITFREKKVGDDREHYVADDTGKFIALARNKTGDKPARLGRQPLPPDFGPETERTLELRFAGDVLTLTLNGAHTLSVRDSARPEGSCAVVFKQGALVKKIETLILDEKR